MKTQRFFASLIMIVIVGTTAFAQKSLYPNTPKTIKYDVIRGNSDEKDTTKYEIYYGTPTDSAFLIINKYSKYCDRLYKEVDSHTKCCYFLKDTTLNKKRAKQIIKKIYRCSKSKPSKRNEYIIDSLSKRNEYIIDSLSMEKALLKHKIDSLYGEEWKWNDDLVYLSYRLTFQFLDKWIEKHDILKGKRARDLNNCIHDYELLKSRMEKLSKENVELSNANVELSNANVKLDVVEDYNSCIIGIAFYDKQNRICGLKRLKDDSSLRNNIVKYDYDKSNFIKEMLCYDYENVLKDKPVFKDKTVFNYDNLGNLTEEKVYQCSQYYSYREKKSKLKERLYSQMEYKYQTDNNQLIPNIKGLDILFLAGKVDVHLFFPLEKFHSSISSLRRMMSIERIIGYSKFNVEGVMFFALQNEQKYLPVVSKLKTEYKDDERIFNWTLDENGIPTKVDIIESDKYDYGSGSQKTTLIFHW